MPLKLQCKNPPSHPEMVAALQKRANGLAASMVKPLMLQTEFDAIRQRLALPPEVMWQPLRPDDAPQIQSHR